MDLCKAALFDYIVPQLKFWFDMQIHCVWQAVHTGCAGMLFGWETIMTFVLVSVVYAVAVGEPSFGNIGPWAVGLSLFSMVFAGKHSC